MADIPGVINYGQVVGRFVSFLADSGDALSVPDEVPLNGTVTLTPRVSVLQIAGATPPRMALAQVLACPVVDGWLCPPGSSTPGVWVIATDQPAAEPSTVQWQADFSFPGNISPGSVIFNVPTSGTVDISLAVPISPAPGTVTVVSHEDALAAAASAADAAAAVSSLLLFVKDYGAVGNGSTDDTAAIDSCRTALLAAGGGEMRFERGKTYSVSKVTVSSNIRYNGNGAVLKASSGTPEGVFQAEGWGAGTPTISGSVITGFTIDANAVAKRGVFLYKADRCRVLDNTMSNFPTSADGGVRLHQYTNDCLVRGNHITGPTDSPFGTVTAFMGVNCVSTTPDNQGGGQNNTLAFGSASNLSRGHIIEGNHLYSGTHGVSLYGAKDCRVIGNHIEGPTHRGVILSPIAVDNIVANNVIRDFGSTGIHFAWGSCFNVIVGNLLVTTASIVEMNGIKGYYGCSDNLVAGNHIEGAGAAGVRFAMGSSRNLIQGNRLRNCVIGVQIQSYLTGAGYYQPTIPPATADNKISGNLITDTPTGITLEAFGAAGLPGTTLHGNDILNPSTAGVLVSEANSQTVSSVVAVGSKITGSPSSGAWVLPRREEHFSAKAANSSLVDTRPDLGIVRTVVPPGPTGLVTIGTANSTRFYRVVEGGTFSKIRLSVGTQSGNIALAVYANSGTGLSATPGTRLATTGSIACPATGINDVALGSTVTVAIGDWLAIGADNATATFVGMTGGGDSTLSAGMVATQSSFPPAASPSIAYQNNRLISLIGIP